MHRHAAFSLLLIVAVPAVGCTRAARFAGGNLAALVEPSRVPPRVGDPRRPGARLVVTWIGHASALIQIDDKYVLTDPVLTTSVGQLSHRLVQPGVEVAHLPPLDAVLISHLHFDHLSFGSLERIERKVRMLVMPRGGLVYLPDFRFDARELARWESWTDGLGLTVTAVPVRHLGWRYGIDAEWMKVAFTAYVIQYHGLTVYFGGDTAYGGHFAATRQRFPAIDLALLAIAPIEPRDYMREMHIDAREALTAFSELGARWMVPIHYDTFINSLDRPGDAERLLRASMAERGLGDERVVILPVGGQRILEAGN